MSNIYNPYIVVPLITWLAAQVIKFLIRGARGNWNFQLLYSSGGMPSAHSAGVMSLATTALVYDGVQGPIFGLAAVFAAIVMYDSFGVRRAAGDQAVAINAILDEMKDRSLRKLELREILGHRRTEVVMGGLLGVAVALLLTVNKWRHEVDWLSRPAEDWEKLVYLASAGLMLVLAVASVLIIKKYWRQTRSIKQLRSILSKSLLFFAVIGGLLSLMQYQAIPTGEWRLWWVTLITVTGLFYGVALLFWWRFIPVQYEAELARIRSKKRR